MHTLHEIAQKTTSPWSKFPASYRQAEMQVLGRWIIAGQSGSVSGLPGCGRSALLGFLAQHPTALSMYLPEGAQLPALILLNLHELPAYDSVTLYRATLRALYHTRARYTAETQTEIQRLYQASVNQQEAFALQSLLYEILFMLQEQHGRIALILNYFNYALQHAALTTFNALRGLRDTFKYSLCIIAGISQEIAYLPEPERLGELYELLDRNSCMVGAMTADDARNLIARATFAAPTLPNEAQQAAMCHLAGNFPALLKWLACWWMTAESQLAEGEWLPILMAQPNLRHRLAKLWQGLTQEEQFVLSAMQQAPHTGELAAQYARTRQRLAHKGLCRYTDTGWQIQGALLQAYLGEMDTIGRGRIWMDQETQTIYQGITRMDALTPQESALLRYLIENPRRPHQKEMLMAQVWPGKHHHIIDNDLQQLVYRLRKKIDTDPPQYIITCKGANGGYQFYPEGRPQ